MKYIVSLEEHNKENTDTAIDALYTNDCPPGCIYDDANGQLHRFGCGKLSRAIVERMMPKQLIIENTDGTAKTIPNVTPSEIYLLIYLSQICSDIGKVDYLSYLEVQRDTYMCNKSYYNSLKGLVAKQYITCDNNYGYSNITIINNLFTKPEHDHAGYVNTNSDAFIKGLSTYNLFVELSVFAKKVFLNLLLKYIPKKGYKFGITTLAEKMQLKNKNLIRCYMTQIEKLIIPNFYYTRKEFDLKNHKKSPVIIVPPKVELTNKSIYPGQTTYEKREFEVFIKQNNIQYIEYKDLKKNLFMKHDYLNNLFGFYLQFKSLGYSYIKDKIKYILLYYGKIGPVQIKTINVALSKELKRRQTCSC